MHGQHEEDRGLGRDAENRLGLGHGRANTTRTDRRSQSLWSGRYASWRYRRPSRATLSMRWVWPGSLVGTFAIANTICMTSENSMSDRTTPASWARLSSGSPAAYSDTRHVWNSRASWSR